MRDCSVRDHGVPNCGHMNITQLSEKFGVPFNTLWDRYSKRGDRGKHLVRPSEQRGKWRIIEGRSLRGWASYFEFHYGVTITRGALSAYYYKERKRGLTDKEIVAKWKERYAANKNNV